MPRPNLSSGGRASKSNNPISQWSQRRQERQMRIQDEAAKEITNNVAANQNALIRQLETIDFIHSRLPAEILAHKVRPEHHYCALEYVARGLVQTLRSDTQVITMDIRKLDEKLLVLVKLFKQAVEQGDSRAAHAAKTALMRGIKDIRSRIPQIHADQAKQFVTKNVAYLDGWITLITAAQETDRLQQNVDKLSERYDQALENNKKDGDELAELIRDNEEYAEAFEKLDSHNFPQDRTTWSHLEREVYNKFIARALDQVNVEVHSILLDKASEELRTSISILDTLNASLIKLPVTTDPDLMNKFQEQVNHMLHELAVSDQKIDETMQRMDALHGNLQMVSRGPGSLRMMEAASESATKMKEQLMDEESRLKNRSDKGGSVYERIGLRNKEELELLKQEAALEEQRIQEELAQTVQAYEEEETELLTN